MAYNHPGVYMEEIPSGSKPISAVSTSTAAFLGSCKQGPINQAILIHSLDEYDNHFGKAGGADDPMGLALLAYYLNGGRDAYVVRLRNSEGAKAASVGLASEASGNKDILKIEATSKGIWANGYVLKVEMAKDGAEFTLRVGRLKPNPAKPNGDKEFVEEEPVYEHLNMLPGSDDYVITRLKASKLIRAELTPDANGFIQKGSLTGSDLDQTKAGYFKDEFAKDAFKDGIYLELRLDGGEKKLISLGKPADLALSNPSDFRTDGQNIAALIATKVKAINADEPYKSFACELGGTGGVLNKFILTSGSKSAESSVRVYDGPLAQSLKLVGDKVKLVEGAANILPKPTGSDITKLPTLGQGGDGGEPLASDYQDFFDKKLAKIPDVSIVVLPGKYAKDDKAYIDAAVSHCENMGNRMAIIDPPIGKELTADEFDQLNLSTSQYSALYYPWVRMPDPAGGAAALAVAPSGFAAGAWAKTDGTRGVWKAPAGVETSLLGVASLEFDVVDGDQDILNPLGVNCLRKFPGYGSVIWGARTLSTKAKPEWRYVPVRRTGILIKESIKGGIMWAVFEPNDHRLWASLRSNIDGFMNGLWRAGAFQGEKASDAYYVRCGLGDTMTQADIDAGQVIVIVGFAPVKPAEFVIVRIQQKAGQQP